MSEIKSLPAALLHNMHQHGFAQSTLIQRSAFPPILKGKDVVVAAETGSGKTAAYLLPICARLLQIRSLAAASTDTRAGNNGNNGTPFVPTNRPAPQQPRAVVVLPTRDLARQTYRFARSITANSGLRAVGITGDADSDTQKALQLPTDMLITVPGRLHRLLQDGVLNLADTRAIVFDEADVLLQEFPHECLSTLTALRPDIPIPPEAEHTAALLRQRDEQRQHTDTDTDTDIDIDVCNGNDSGATPPGPGSTNSGVHTPRFSLANAPTIADAAEWIARSLPPHPAREPTPRDGNAPQPEKGSARRVQVVMVGASIASQAMKQVCMGIQNMMVVASDELHQPPPRMRHVFEKMKGPNQKPDALLAAIRASPRPANPRTIVFCNTASTVSWACRFLRENGHRVAALTGSMSKATKKDNADAFLTTRSADILVCTDVVARGMNFDVGLVINFDLPHTSVDYLHRAGRAARAGASGAVISLVGRSERHRAHLLSVALRHNAPLDGVYAHGPAGGAKQRSPAAGAGAGAGAGRKQWYTAKIVGRRTVKDR